MSAAEQLYTSSVLEAQVNADGDIDTGDARRAVRIGSGVQGILDQSRADQIEATNLKTHEDYEKAAEKRAGWVEFGSTAALGAGVATAAFFLPAAPVLGVGALLVPIFTDTATGAVEQVMGARGRRDLWLRTSICPGSSVTGTGIFVRVSKVLGPRLDLCVRRFRGH